MIATEEEENGESIMEITLRWYGSNFDMVTLENIRPIPGVTGVITTLYDTAHGEGGVESVSVH